MKSLNYSQTVIYILAGFLIIYHAFKIYTLLADINDFQFFMDMYGIQSLIRITIIFSLIWVIPHKKYALILMWVCIGSLVISQLIGVADMNSLKTTLSPFKGFIVPSIITIIKLSKNPDR